MNKLDLIKQKQMDAGQDPCARPGSLDAHKPKPPPNRLESIKQQQIKDGADPTAAPIKMSATDDLAHYQAAMDADKAQLKKTLTLKEKAVMKIGFLPTYADFVNAYISGKHDYPNSVVVQVAIWCFDIGDIERGLRIALVLSRQAGQVMPKGFDRDLRTFICDEVYDWANAQLKNEQSASPYLDQVAETMDAESWDLHPAVASKTYVMLAKHKFRLGQYAETVELCERAQQVNPEGAGVKTLLQQARAKLS